MKEQFAILPELPIVGNLKLSTRDGKNLCYIDVAKNQNPSKLDPFFQDCFVELEKFLKGQSKTIKLPLELSGITPFQLKVLQEMKRIPYGQTATYKELGEAIKSKGYQAIGSACGRNPFMLIYPCHRILGSGGPGGFAHGQEMKLSLLKLEELNK